MDKAVGLAAPRVLEKNGTTATKKKAAAKGTPIEVPSHAVHVDKSITDWEGHHLVQLVDNGKDSDEAETTSDEEDSDLEEAESQDDSDEGDDNK